MVYRHLDPSRDWDAYCDDHPDPPDYDEDTMEGYLLSACCTSDVTRTKKRARICTSCGKFCHIDEDATVNAYLEDGDH